jgi:hypothetical protein
MSVLERRADGPVTADTVSNAIAQFEKTLEHMSDSGEIPSDRVAKIRATVAFMRSTSPEGIQKIVAGVQSLYRQLKNGNVSDEDISARIKDSYPEVVLVLPFLRRQEDGVKVSFILADQVKIPALKSRE